MIRQLPKQCAALALLLSLALAGCSDGSDKLNPVVSCANAAAQALQMCTSTVNTTLGACYANGDSACTSDNADLLAAQTALASTLQNSCSDGEMLNLSVDALVGRLQNSCQSEADSIAWRTFGGPQGAVWPEASDEEKACLLSAHTTVTEFVDGSLIAINECLASDDCNAQEIAEIGRASCRERV